MRPVLIVGGAPRVAIDAVRYLSSRASGATAIALASLLGEHGCATTLLLGEGAAANHHAERFVERSDLEARLRGWIAGNRDGVVVMSAAVNDYQLKRVELVDGGNVQAFGTGDKVPSGGDELLIRLEKTDKVIDKLRGQWGLRGPVVGFKYQERHSVLTAAQALRERVGAAVVVANSLCGTVQALVYADSVCLAADRSELLRMLAERIIELAADE